MAHPRDVKSIARAKVKTDKRGSEMLAHLLQTDLAPEVYQRSKENRGVQKVLRQRAFYAEAMARVKNRIHVLIAQQREEVRREGLARQDRQGRESLVAVGGGGSGLARDSGGF